MKQVLFLVVLIITLFQSGCANRPGIDETARQDQEDEQKIKQSDAFARSLAP